MNLELLGQIVVASSDGGSSSDGRFLGLVFFLSGFVFYGLMYKRYRNADERHRHEAETEARMLDVRGMDQRVDTAKGVANAKMKGANNHAVRGSSNGGNGLPSALNGIVDKFPG